MKIQCDNCPAKNKRVKLLTVYGKRMALCEKCVAAARRLGA